MLLICGLLQSFVSILVIGRVGLLIFETVSRWTVMAEGWQQLWTQQRRGHRREDTGEKATDSDECKEIEHRNVEMWELKWYFPWHRYHQQHFQPDAPLRSRRICPKALRTRMKSRRVCRVSIIQTRTQWLCCWKAHCEVLLFAVTYKRVWCIFWHAICARQVYKGTLWKLDSVRTFEELWRANKSILMYVLLHAELATSLWILAQNIV